MSGGGGGGIAILALHNFWALPISEPSKYLINWIVAGSLRFAVRSITFRPRQGWWNTVALRGVNEVSCNLLRICTFYKGASRKHIAGEPEFRTTPHRLRDSFSVGYSARVHWKVPAHNADLPTFPSPFHLPVSSWRTPANTFTRSGRSVVSGRFNCGCVISVKPATAQNPLSLSLDRDPSVTACFFISVTLRAMAESRVERDRAAYIVSIQGPLFGVRAPDGAALPFLVFAEFFDSFFFVLFVSL